MNLTELKNTPVAQLVQMCEQNGIENVARLSKKEIIFQLLKFSSKNGEDIYAAKSGTGAMYIGGTGAISLWGSFGNGGFKPLQKDADDFYCFEVNTLDITKYYLYLLRN